MIGYLWLRMIVVLTTAQLGNVYAGTFHTIIGPDGRPMVVQKNNIQTKKVLESNQKNQILYPQSQVMTAPPKLQRVKSLENRELNRIIQLKIKTTYLILGLLIKQILYLLLFLPKRF